QEINNHNDQTDNDDNQEEMILLEKLPSKLYDEICAITSNNYMENDNMGIEFSCLLELDTIDDPHKLSKKIAELVEQGDGYNYIYKKSYDLKKVPGIHAWWNKFIKEKYVRDNNNQLNSMKVLLEEYNYSIVLENITEGIKYLGFITPFFNLLLKNKEIVVDAT
ncbi:13728_t:CDS:2, partial [Racocetra fulgida]